MILAVLQARVSSSRLPGKVLKPILGKPMLALQIERCRRAKRLDNLILATSSDPSDDALVELAAAINVRCVRGSLNDVLDRFYQAAAPERPQYVVRLTGDCPLADPQVIDELVEFCLAGGYDYAANCVEPSYPDGLDAEICTFAALETAWREAQLPSEREHVTPFIRNHPERFRCGALKNSVDLSHLRWTVDEPEDFALVSAIYAALYPANPEFDTAAVLQLLERRPELKTQNVKFDRNEGYLKSLKEDRAMFLKNRLTNSLAMQERARKRIPGLSQLLSKRPDMFSRGVWPGYFSEAKGVEVTDLDGNRYIDMSIGGIGATVLGYADPDVDAAALEAIRKGVSSSLNAPEEVELADLLCELHPWAEKVRFARTGGESMAIAVRIARAHTKRDVIAFCGYHGWHDWYLAANLGTENALGEHLIPGLNPLGVPQGLKGTAFPFRYNDLSELKAIAAAHGANLAAIVMEPIRNIRPTPEFVAGVHEIARSTGAALVIDEISAGFRMNTGGAHLDLGFQPDIAVFSKALGNGYPIGAVIGRDEIMEAAQSTFISSTYWTERLGPAAAIAMVRKHARLNAGPHLMKIGTLVQEGWQRLGASHNLPLHVGGIPPLSHFGFEDAKAPEMKAYFIQLMLEQGFLASTSFYSMYAHTEDHVSAYLAAADQAFAEIARVRARNEFEKALIGSPAASGFKRLN